MRWLRRLFRREPPFPGKALPYDQLPDYVEDEDWVYREDGSRPRFLHFRAQERMRGFGIMAFHEGRKREDCPYEEQSGRWHFWVYGYDVEKSQRQGAAWQRCMNIKDCYYLKQGTDPKDYSDYRLILTFNEPLLLEAPR